MIRSTIAVLLFSAAAILPKAPPHASPAPQPSPGGPQWNLKTVQMNANMRTGLFSAPEHVLLIRADGSTVNADRALGNYKLHQAQLYGHVNVQDAGGTLGLRSTAAVQGKGPATLTCDELHLDDGAHTYDAMGHVHYVQSDTTIDAEKAHLNDITHQLDLSGNVHVVQGDRTLDAAQATYNTVNGLGDSNGDVTIVMPAPSPSIATPKPINVKAPKIP